MRLRLTATLVKQYFQYRCERQVRYAMVPDEDRLGLGIAEAAEPESPWARAGVDFEKAVVSHLATTVSVLRPPAGQKQLDEVRTAAFLRRERPEPFAHQVRLALRNSSAFRRRWQLPDGIELAAGYPDLLRLVGDGPRTLFQLIDVKAVQVPTAFHKAQVAFYSLLLEEVLREAGLPHAVHPVGQIWHPAPDAGPGEVKWLTVDFRLTGYRAQVADFFRGALARIAAAVVAPGRDDTRFHLYFKCEECTYLPHCEKAIGDGYPVADWDVSAVPGVSHASKQTLLELGVRTVGELARTPAELTKRPGVGWGLRNTADLLRERAGTLLDRRVRRLSHRLTHLMPPRVDAGLYLLFDQDPVEGRLAVLGCLFRWNGSDEVVTAAVTAPGPAAERAALLKVLTAALTHLAVVDAHNRTPGADPAIAHLFVYEPAEARDLQAALGRHLGDSAVRRGLLHLVRMFPPEPLQPDPEYRGRRHLPATALRRVFDSLYAIPAKVSHDLRRVSEAFAQADPPLGRPYHPGPDFARPFSARLNIDRCRDLKNGRMDPALVEADVRARLTALADLVQWVLDDNARAAVPFLRLKKEPFRFQTSFDPLRSDDLDLLAAQELLASRAAELATLTALALPVEERRQRFRCLAPLTLREQKESPRYKGGRRLIFRGPADGSYSEIGPTSFGVVLTDGDPDLLLDPGAWPNLFVRVADVVSREDGVTVTVDVYADAWEAGTLSGLVAKTPEAGWVLDQVYADENTPRLQKFLQHLAGGGAEA